MFVFWLWQGFPVEFGRSRAHCSAGACDAMHVLRSFVACSQIQVVQAKSLRASEDARRGFELARRILGELVSRSCRAFVVTLAATACTDRCTSIYGWSRSAPRVWWLVCPDVAATVVCVQERGNDRSSGRIYERCAVSWRLVGRCKVGRNGLLRSSC